ncbi:MAG: ribosome recycling factor [Dehalococcoidia bacterium]|nr:ribosome recycling factor [Dehalococcoidia bacterium]
MELTDILKQCSERMNSSCEFFVTDIKSIRTGRATTNLLENIKIDYHGSSMPLNQLSQISVSDQRSLIVQPWDKSAVDMISKGIQTSDLGITPQIEGDTLRVNIPPMTEETRKNVVKLLKQKGEQSKVSIRNIRRDVQEDIRKLEKEGSCSEDDSRRAITELQKLTDQSIKVIDDQSSIKENEIMQV